MRLESEKSREDIIPLVLLNKKSATGAARKSERKADKRNGANHAGRPLVLFGEDRFLRLSLLLCGV